MEKSIIGEQFYATDPMDGKKTRYPTWPATATDPGGA